MPRRKRRGPPHTVYHVLNRAGRRATLFATDDDYRGFLEVLERAKQREPTGVLAFALMPTHWHLILLPADHLQLSRFMHWLTMTHTQRWHREHGTVGTGPVYQGRFKGFPVGSDEHFLTVARYVERNPVRAGLVERVEDWHWSSAWHRCNSCDRGILDGWPIPMPADWVALANEPQNQVHLSAVREAIVDHCRAGRRRAQSSTASVVKKLQTAPDP